jgi:hypothetical protein
MSAISRAPWRPVAAGCTRPYSSPCDGPAIAPTSAATAWMRYPPAREPRPCPCARGSARWPPFRVELGCLVQRAGGAAPFGRRADCLADVAMPRALAEFSSLWAVWRWFRWRLPRRWRALIWRTWNPPASTPPGTGRGRGAGAADRRFAVRATERPPMASDGCQRVRAPLPATIDAARRRSGICRRSSESASGVSVRRGAREWTRCGDHSALRWRERRPVSAISSQVYCGVTRPAAAAGAPVGAAP